MTALKPITVAAVLAIGRSAGISAGRPRSRVLRRELGGASRQTWSFDALVGGHRHELILRRDPPTPAAKGKRERSPRSTAPPNSACCARPSGRRAGAGSAVRAHARGRAGRGLRHAPHRRHRHRPQAPARSALRRAPARRSPASSARSWRASMPSTSPTLPPLAHREAADQVASLRGAPRLAGQPQPVFELALSWLDRRKPAPTRARRCWCMATIAPATISPTRAA